MSRIYSRRILFVATGLSPQVVTETLYALGIAPARGSTPFVPTEVHIITTADGAKYAKAALLHPDNGQFHALLNDYPQLGAPAFNASHIHVIHDAAGQPLADIRSPQDNACAADSITQLMSELTRDDATQLHVSIAGGRKTMGFYLGYAFSLFARPQDELSHVLASSPFEGHPEFFFPPARPRRLPLRGGQHIDTADACITLACIPVVRLRHGQPEALLAGRTSYGDTVAAIQQSLAPPHLLIDLPARRVECSGKPVQLAPALIAWLAWWAQNVTSGRGPQSWRDADPQQFLSLYRCVVTIDATAYEDAQMRLRESMEKQFFQENNSKLQRALKNQLGLTATPYLLVNSGKRPHTRRSLMLHADQIELIGVDRA